MTHHPSCLDRCRRPRGDLSARWQGHAHLHPVVRRLPAYDGRRSPVRRCHQLCGWWRTPNGRPCQRRPGATTWRCRSVLTRWSPAGCPSSGGWLSHWALVPGAGCLADAPDARLYRLPCSHHCRSFRGMCGIFQVRGVSVSSGETLTVVCTCVFDSAHAPDVASLSSPVLEWPVCTRWPGSSALIAVPSTAAPDPMLPAAVCVAGWGIGWDRRPYSGVDLVRAIRCGVSN